MFRKYHPVLFKSLNRDIYGTYSTCWGKQEKYAKVQIEKLPGMNYLGITDEGIKLKSALESL
jgi:hypothetical protein